MGPDGGRGHVHRQRGRLPSHAQGRLLREQRGRVPGLLRRMEPQEEGGFKGGILQGEGETGEPAEAGCDCV